MNWNYPPNFEYERYILRVGVLNHALLFLGLIGNVIGTSDLHQTYSTRADNFGPLLM